MPRITPVGSKKRKLEETRPRAPKQRKKIRKQKHYHSSSEDEDEDEDQEFAPVSLQSDEEIAEPAAAKIRKVGKKDTSSLKKAARVERPPVDSDGDGFESDDEDLEDDDGDAMEEDAEDDIEDDSDTNTKRKKKRNDPEAFSTSISKILATKLSTTQRSDPVLPRSLAASQARKQNIDTKLEVKAKARLRAEKQAAMARGRTKDVLGIERGITGEVAEREKALRKIATRGVIQLFNAFRSAHERAEAARKDEHSKGTVGMGERDRKVGEVSKAAFLERIGGKA